VHTIINRDYYQVSPYNEVLAKLATTYSRNIPHFINLNVPHHTHTSLPLVLVLTKIKTDLTLSSLSLVPTKLNFTKQI
jgi:hypothetical protein